MQTATILPTSHLQREEGAEFHMALAHLVVKDVKYRRFFLKHSQASFILLDNGVVETGEPMSIEQILGAALLIRADEFVLPDVIGDQYETLNLGYGAILKLREMTEDDEVLPVCAVPQGQDYEEWMDCLLEMLTWPVQTIGVSRFTNSFAEDRLALLRDASPLIDSDKEIHLLGCPGDPIEIHRINEQFPGRIRSVDSGIAAIYASTGAWLGVDDKPNVELDFSKTLGAKRLSVNIERWKRRLEGQSWKKILEEVPA